MAGPEASCAGAVSRQRKLLEGQLVPSIPIITKNTAEGSLSAHTVTLHGGLTTSYKFVPGSYSVGKLDGIARQKKGGGLNLKNQTNKR